MPQPSSPEKAWKLPQSQELNSSILGKCIIGRLGGKPGALKVSHSFLLNYNGKGEYVQPNTFSLGEGSLGMGSPVLSV